MKRIILISAVSAIIIIFCIIPGYLYPIFDILDAVDRQITIALNFKGGVVLDAIMYAMSSRITCSIFVLSIIALFWNRKSKLRKYIVIILGLTIVITLCDQISSSFIKPYVCRLRPSHTEGVSDFLHYVYGYKGGRYGFVSSHAANTFGVAAFLSLEMRNRKMAMFLFLWAIIVSYSRIYLGVHYFGDVVCGGILGIILGIIIALITRIVVFRYVMWKHSRVYKSQLSEIEV